MCPVTANVTTILDCRDTASSKDNIMFKITTFAALLAATIAVPAQARGWLPAPIAPASQATASASTAAFGPSGKGLPFASASERAAQQSWWAMRAERRAERRMAACAAMPACNGHRMTTATNG